MASAPDPSILRTETVTGNGRGSGKGSEKGIVKETGKGIGKGSGIRTRRRGEVTGRETEERMTGGPEERESETEVGRMGNRVTGREAAAAAEGGSGGVIGAAKSENVTMREEGKIEMGDLSCLPPSRTSMAPICMPSNEQ